MRISVGLGIICIMALHGRLFKESWLICLLTIPKTKAVEVANLLVDNGVKAIWNFAHTDLNLPDNIIVENVHLSESLMRLSYNITRYNEEHEGK